MLSIRKVIALLLLGIFQVFALHQSLTHVHHIHYESGSSEVKINGHLHDQVENQHHHHLKNTHHHHQRDDAKNQQDQEDNHHDGLLGFILGNHSHSDDTNHAPVVTNPTSQNLKVKDLGGLLLAPTIISATLQNIGSRRRFYYSTYIPHNPYNPLFNHRGPPAII